MLNKSIISSMNPIHIINCLELLGPSTAVHGTLTGHCRMKRSASLQSCLVLLIFTLLLYSSLVKLSVKLVLIVMSVDVSCQSVSCKNDED